MPKLLKLQEPEIVAFIDQRVAKAEAKMHKDEAQRFKRVVRTVRDAIKTSGLDNKTVKGLTAHVVEALSAYTPSVEAQAE